MKQLILRIKGKIPLFLFCLSIAVGCQLLAISSSRAQISSAAFDPNCYQPKIGIPGVVDSIYGSHENEELGYFIKNLWPEKGNSYDNLVIANDSEVRNGYFPLFETGPMFNLHSLKSAGVFNLGSGNAQVIEKGKNPKHIIHRAHFRSTKYLDILYNSGIEIEPPRIYWQDDNGEYDSTRFTELRSPLAAKHGVQYGNASNIYSANLFSDTVNDILFSVVLHDVDPYRDSVYLSYFKGGEQLFQKGQISFADSSLYFDTLGGTPGFNGIQGDFRGAGKEDLIAVTSIGNCFYYKNDHSFSLLGFAHSLKYDTLIAHWESGLEGWFFKDNLTMHAFNKPAGDSSIDLLFCAGSVFIFKGGANFGSQRLNLDKPDFLIHHPEFYDPIQWHLVSTGGLFDCGKMTGTQNRVLFVGGSMDGSFYGFDFFYVLGDAMDDKVDMYFDRDNQGTVFGIDTLTADPDNLQDIILGYPWYGKNAGNELNGTIWVVHGSKKIPDKTRAVKRSSKEFDNISLYPNPVTNGSCILDLDEMEFEFADITIRDLLGRKIFQSHIQNPEKIPILMSGVPSGTYILEISSKSFSKRIQFSLLK